MFLLNQYQRMLYLPAIQPRSRWLSGQKCSSLLWQIAKLCFLIQFGVVTLLLHDDQRSSVIELIRKYPALFHDVPSQTTVVSHDIDVGECPPIKQHPYCVNPHKRQLMKNEVDYCCNMDLLYPAKVHGVLLVCLFPSLITLYDFVLTTGK